TTPSLPSRTAKSRLRRKPTAAPMCRYSRQWTQRNSTADRATVPPVSVDPDGSRESSGTYEGETGHRLPFVASGDGKMVCEKLEFSENENSILRTARLALRRPRAGDAEAVARLANDREIAENTMVIPYPYTLADARKFIAHVEEMRIETFLAFAAISGQETLIGCG